MSTPAALGVVLVLMVGVNVWVHLRPTQVQMLTGPFAAALLILVGRISGLSWEELGLAPEHLLAGAAYGGVMAAGLAAAYVVAVAVPYTRGAFRDTRYRIGPGAALFLALVTIPLSTVVFEETAFRSVLWGLLAQDVDGAAVVVITAALFGLWHVLPSLKLLRSNPALSAGGPTSPHRAIVTVLGTVLFTAAAGVVLAELRRRSDSVLAPVVLHWAANGLGVLAAARVWAITARSTHGR